MAVDEVKSCELRRIAGTENGAEARLRRGIIDDVAEIVDTEIEPLRVGGGRVSQIFPKLVARDFLVGRKQHVAGEYQGDRRGRREPMRDANFQGKAPNKPNEKHGELYAQD